MPLAAVALVSVAAAAGLAGLLWAAMLIVLNQSPAKSIAEIIRDAEARP